LRDSVQTHFQSAPLGYLPVEPAIKLPERHLGLQLAGEVVTQELLDSLAHWVEGTLDLDNVLAIARTAKPVTTESQSAVQLPGRRETRIGIAKDAAFQFYYDENCRYLCEAGAELVEFSPIGDSRLPDNIDGLYLGGGYPELHAAALAANKSMQDSVRSFAERGGPVYAECGGFMYLTEAIIDGTGQEHEMCGIFPTRARMQPRLAGLGYAEIELWQDAAWLRANARMRAHEFRYSTIDEMPASIRRAYRVHGSREDRLDGYLMGSVLGSYFHVHFGSYPAFADHFVAAAKAWQEHAKTIGTDL
jgi:cobyrinic acid a,c-diamide synthase